MCIVQIANEQCFTCCAFLFCVQQHETGVESKDKHVKQDTLAAEWESFEKFIQSGHDEQPGQEAAERHIVTSTWTSGLVLDTPSVGGRVAYQPCEVRQKRVFREVESDSDGNSSSDSEDESYLTLPAAAMKSASSSKVDRQSSSSDSSQSAKNKFVTKSSSDSSSSSDAEKPTEQTNFPLGKCYFLSLVTLFSAIFCGVTVMLITLASSMYLLRVFIRCGCNDADTKQ